MTPKAPLVLVIDLGTTSLRCSVIDAQGIVCARRQSVVPERRNDDGLSWDGGLLAAYVLRDVRALADDWVLAGIAIANQRTTALVWDAATGTALGPVLSWSDGRTRGLDRTLRKRGVAMIPGLAASKWRWLLDRADPDGTRAAAGQLRVGTLETWLIWILTDGSFHVSDHVNASHSGLFDLVKLDWNRTLAAELNLHSSLLPQLVSCMPEVIPASAISGAPLILAVIGDQQASLVGQGCLAPGTAKITFGTSAVLNMVTGTAPLANPSRQAFGNVALSTPDGVSFGAEAAVMSAGSSVEWLVRLGVLRDVAALDAVVQPDQRSGAVFVPALEGLGVPHWQPGARGSFFGLSGATGAGGMTRAVLDGIVSATAEIIDQIEDATGQRLIEISVDGGLTRSNAFNAILAATVDRPLCRATDAEATTRGAAILAQRALGIDVPFASDRTPLDVPPGTMPADRTGWQDAVALTVEFTKTRNDRV
ncbi:FGGY-family carbohydrate kinase [Paracoccus jeotgali]|uniref:Glycerol kinase n=1 Tax=Paracoccus jeotgali TaxID=2065379 RepID=A0A2K9MJF0_9RHOB|nr:FGGY-family carbohydrate kinase [Paracoccus jeotgali]AUM75757.1 hypothetical protein CYR75_15110 [Paracoccus jeotgali]